MSKATILASLSKFKVSQLKTVLAQLESETSKKVKPQKKKKKTTKKWNKPLVVISGGNTARGRFSRNYTRQELANHLAQILPQYEYTIGARKGARYVVFSDRSSAPSKTKLAKNPQADILPISKFLSNHHLSLKLED